MICRQESKTMDARQVTGIRILLLEAADAIDRVNAIVSTLGSDERALLATPLDEISSALHFKLLQKLYLPLPRACRGRRRLGRHHDMSHLELGPSHRRQQLVAAVIGVELSAALALDRRTAHGR